MTPGALPAVTVPSFLNAGFSAAERFDRRVGTNGFVAIEDNRRSLSLRDRDRQDFVLEPARSVAPRGFLVAPRRELVLLRPADVVVLGDDFARVAHVALLERAPEAVVDHRIDDLAVAHPQPLADARQQVRALLIDSMPPATAMSMSPVAMPCAASMTAFSPEPQTLLIVSAAT